MVVAAHDGFDYDELRGAVQAVLRGAELLCAGRDATFPMPDGPWPGTGADRGRGRGRAPARRPRRVGKPEPQLFLTALTASAPGRALVVGDRLDADVGGARAAGLDARSC